jgi:hypothetical protein
MKKREKRRLLTNKVIEKRLQKIKKLDYNCNFLKNLKQEPHRLAKKVDCGDLGCVETKCPFYSELKHERKVKKTYRMIDMKRKEG